jgi:acetyl-CoA carboxylase biotin carboxyl carrier protein
MDIERIQRLIDLMKQSGVAELSIEQPDLKISIKRGGAPAKGAHAAPDIAEGDSSAAGLTLQPVEVLAQRVGVFHHGDGSDPASVARVGRKVAAGQVLGTIEAMKVKDEVRCPLAGMVSEVLIEDGAAVQYGQVLFRLTPEMEQGNETHGADDQ